MKSIKLNDKTKSIVPLCSIRSQTSTGNSNLLLLVQWSLRLSAVPAAENCEAATFWKLFLALIGARWTYKQMWWLNRRLFGMENVRSPKLEVIYTTSIFTLASTVCHIVYCVNFKILQLRLQKKWRNQIILYLVICFYPVFLNAIYQHNLVLNDQLISQRLFVEYKFKSFVLHFISNII